jgi:hypothetical protein
LSNRSSGETGEKWDPGNNISDYKVVSVNEHYDKAPEKFPFSEVLDCTSDSPNSYTRTDKGSQNMSHYCGCKRTSNGR